MTAATVAVLPRDRLSSVPATLESIAASTPEPHELLIVAGRVPRSVQRGWASAAPGARLVLEPDHVTATRLRALALAEASGQHVAMVEGDVLVRPGWLSALRDALVGGGHAMAVPLMLEDGTRIHSAGNDLYLSWVDGTGYAGKHLRHFRQPYGETTNLQRDRVSYPELHCLLVDAAAARAADLFAGEVLEPLDLLMAVRLERAGLSIVFEPNAVVDFGRSSPVRAEDVPLFTWRWDPARNLASMHVASIEANLDLSEHGGFGAWLLEHNRQVGLLARIGPPRLGLWLERRSRPLAAALCKLVSAPRRLWRRLAARYLGYTGWQGPVLPG